MLQMTMKAVTVIVLCLAVAASASVLFTRTTVPKGWTQGPRAVADEQVTFMLALKQQNLDTLDRVFREVSNPQHPNWQQFRTIEEINAIVAPRAEDKAAALLWLRSTGVEPAMIKDLGDALEVCTTVAVAERLFNTKFYSFTSDAGKTIVRSFGAYSLPADLVGKVEMVIGISSFPIPHLKLHKGQRTNAADGVAVQTAWAFYNIPPLTTGSWLNTSQSVVEFQGENFDPKDFENFAKQSKITISPVASAHIVGPNDPTAPQDESTLDIEMIGGVNTEADNWFWLEKGNGWLYAFATHFFATQTVPMINSISYGWYEGDQCSISPDECQQLGVNSYGYVARVNTEFQKIGTRGITLLSASGDSGCHGRTDPDCQKKVFSPDFPGSSPYVTAVGGTQIEKGTPLSNPPPICALGGVTCAGGGTEVAVSYAVAQYTSGGGFSNVAPLQDYQTAAVQNFLKTSKQLPPATMFNSSGRGYPDVAALGNNCLINLGGSVEPVGGTSCATPIFGGVLSLLNQAVIQKTGKPVGFANYLLYQMQAADPTTFNDVTVGDNRCTEDGCALSCKGFYCQVGWDPVSGLGTPNYPKMLAYVQSHLPSRN